MVKTIHTQLKQYLAQLKDLSVPYHRLTFNETTSGWISEIRARVDEVKKKGFTCMEKPEY